MRSKLEFSLVLLLVPFALWGQPIQESRSVRVDAMGAVAAAKVLTGRGVTLGEQVRSRPYALRFDAEVVWKPVRDVTSPHGTRHVFYRQYLQWAGGPDAWLAGSALGVHYRRNGTVGRVEGRQYTEVSLDGAPRVQAKDAYFVAQRSLAKSRQFDVRPLETLVPAERAAREAAAELMLVPGGDGRFRFAWSTVGDLDGRTRGVLLDATTEDVLTTWPLDTNANCHPSDPWTEVFAVGSPVRWAGQWRWIAANPATRPDGYQYEAFWKGSNWTPNISVLQQTDDPAWRCATTLNYTLIPVQTNSWYPFYDDHPSGPWEGKAAGDAMHRTRETMDAFRQMLRAGWDGGNGDANIILESNQCAEAYDCGTFRMNTLGNQYLPPTPCVIVAPEQVLYNITTSLDLIAHEWGHGVIYTTANFNFNTNPHAFELHEGFADVVGQMVEKLREPYGFGLERSSDWDIGEDAWDGVALRGFWDDGNGAAHDYGPYHNINHALHKNDPSGGGSHERGNMLNAVFALMAEGGTNPVCGSDSMPCVEVPAIGFDAAARILFEALQFYMSPDTRWEHLPQLVSDAAYDIYSSCNSWGGYGAEAEQDAVDKAFAAIGYPRNTPPSTCN